MDNDVNTSDLGKGRAVGDKHYRAWVGPPEYYDLIGAMQFRAMTLMGLREFHSLLDIGCGSLRAGRLFLTYLQSGRYYGMDPERWAVEDGLKAQFGMEIVELKRPTFSYDSQFTLTEFGVKFDFLIAHSIFTHASQAQIRRCLAQAQQVMTDNSIFLATFDETHAQNYEGEEWVYPGITEYTRVFMEQVANDAGLRVRFPAIEHPWGQTWMAIIREGSCVDLEALENGEHFNPRHYLMVHKPDERNERIRGLNDAV